MTRIVWWIGDVYIRFERHRTIAVLTCFVVLSVVAVLSLHLADKYRDGTLPWQSAIPVGVLVGFICTGFVGFIASDGASWPRDIYEHWRRRPP